MHRFAVICIIFECFVMCSWYNKNSFFLIVWRHFLLHRCHWQWPKTTTTKKSTTKHLPPCLRITEVFWAPCRQQRSQHYCVRTFAKVHLLSHLKLVPRYIVLHHCPDLSNIYLCWSKVNYLLFHNLCCNFIYLGPWMLVYPHVLGFKDSFSFLFFSVSVA